MRGPLDSSATPTPPSPHPSALIHCVAPPQPQDQPHYDGAIVEFMLSLSYVKQKLGLNNLVIQNTAAYVSEIHQSAYYNLAYTHTGCHDTNTRSRANILSHMKCQVDEDEVIDSRLTNNYNGRPHHTVRLPASIPTSDYQSIPGWIARRVCHTVQGTSLWFAPHSWFMACQVCVNPAYKVPPTVNSSPVAIAQWEDVRHTSLQFLHNPPDPITQIWFWVHSDNVQAFQAVCPTHLLVASCHGHSLYAPSNAMSQLSMIHIQRLHYLFVHEGKSHFPYSAPPHSPNITRALTHANK